jgi:hypothetical protein
MSVATLPTTAEIATESDPRATLLNLVSAEFAVLDESTYLVAPHSTALLVGR